MKLERIKGGMTYIELTDRETDRFRAGDEDMIDQINDRLDQIDLQPRTRAMEDDPRVSWARALLFAADRDRSIRRRESLEMDQCQCGDQRRLHGTTASINYSEGPCSACGCSNFIIAK